MIKLQYKGEADPNLLIQGQLKILINFTSCPRAMNALTASVTQI